MNAITEKDLAKLKKNGFINIKKFFSKEEISNLLSETESIFPNTKYIAKRDNQDESQKGDMEPTTQKMTYLTKGTCEDGTFGAPILGCSKLIDTFMQRLFNNKHFQEICNTLVGKNSKIFTFHYRVLSPEAKRLMLHQDDFCQLSFQIPLNDIKKNDHSTCFVEGSHLSSFSLLDNMFGGLSKYLPRFFLKYCYKKYIAEIGDIAIFLNKTYHGTEINKTQNSSKSIFIAMNAEGGHLHKKIYMAPDKTYYNEDFKLSIGEKIYNRLFDNHYLINFKGKYFTFQKEKLVPTGYISLASNKSSKRSIICLNNASKNKENFVNQIIFDKQKVSIKTQIIILYLRLLIFAKNIIKKMIRK